ncbi:hypothetical protein [Bradyrhizobium sp. S3.3.6]|uniref:hypothetical protein n=1 Tax=Bradyrhizobium sp. S3.3.6 TaxID=3156429 RepID=UPI00339A3853
MDVLRNELNGKLDAIRAEMLTLLRADADFVTQMQHRVTLIAAFLTLLAAILGLVFALMVSAAAITVAHLPKPHSRQDRLN